MRMFTGTQKALRHRHAARCRRAHSTPPGSKTPPYRRCQVLQPIFATCLRPSRSAATAPSPRAAGRARMAVPARGRMLSVCRRALRDARPAHAAVSSAFLRHSPTAHGMRRASSHACSRRRRDSPLCTCQPAVYLSHLIRHGVKYLLRMAPQEMRSVDTARRLCTLATACLVMRAPWRVCQTCSRAVSAAWSAHAARSFRGRSSGATAHGTRCVP